MQQLTTDELDMVAKVKAEELDTMAKAKGKAKITKQPVDPVAEEGEIEPSANGSDEPAPRPAYRRYLIVTHNPDYTGKVYGVPITNGIGVLDAAAVNPKLGHQMSDILVELKNMGGYEIHDVTSADVIQAIQDVREAQEKKESQILELINILRTTGYSGQLLAALAQKT